MSAFAKEMLVWPEEIKIHKIKNPQISDVKATSTTVPTLPDVVNMHGNSASVDLSQMTSGRRGAASMQVQPPMKFGSYQTGTERLAESII